MRRLLLVLLMAAAQIRAAELIAAAASDLAPLAANLQSGFARVSDVSLKFTFASSGSLAQQIQNGAPFDVFLSADENYVRQLVSSGSLDPQITVYASGRLGLWSKSGIVKSIDDLKNPQVKHIAIANPGHAPYGAAAKKALETRGLWMEIQPKMVYGENVRQAMQFAETGNADAVITSWTLLAGRGIPLPAEWHDPIRQSGGVVKTSKQMEAARAFLKFLVSPEGRKILSSGGLFPP
ncbi:MAG TPA: molybdate ABC transporter substrate-binding protein [Bryobacteraceae bacterium]|nr:molybdate ABC transporter substrate-binding protein [Bryobacteraceae bacterium]